VPRSRIHQIERVLSFATRFLEEVREEIRRARLDGSDAPPLVRTVHERAGHATPEFRTLTIPVGEGFGGMSPEVLAETIARYAGQRSPDCLLLGLEAMNADGPLLVAEARCRFGTRLFWMQPFQHDGSSVEWGEPLGGGWRDPGEEEMILDAAYGGVAQPMLSGGR
jgi:hypothetical protein